MDPVENTIEEENEDSEFQLQTPTVDEDTTKAHDQDVEVQQEETIDEDYINPQDDLEFHIPVPTDNNEVTDEDEEDKVAGSTHSGELIDPQEDHPEDEDNEDAFPPLPDIEDPTEEIPEKQQETKPKQKEPDVIHVPRAPRVPQIRTAEIMYKAARPISASLSPFGEQSLYQQRRGSRSTVATLAGGGPDRDISLQEKSYLQRFSRQSQSWNPNPLVSTPMRPRKWRRMTWLDQAPPRVPAWKVREELDKERRDHETAVDLGYETLIGNLHYMTIPHARDLNRSWQNFLSDDPLEWGFPYFKGSLERPRKKQPEPYLAHQVKERLWKYPKTRLFQADDM